MIRWFGPAPFAAMCRDTPRVDIPFGQLCDYCDTPIGTEDYGVFYSGSIIPTHHECFMRQMLGSVGHQRHRCSCFGGEEEDPPNMSRRDAAIAAYTYWLTRNQHL